MFRHSRTTTPPTLFTGFSQTLGDKKMKRIEDKNSWDNIFRKQIMEKIDERVFSVLYSEENGRPNAPIRLLAGMMILKEGFNLSDAELYEQCRFNLLFMNALGLSNVSDEVPVESTYYDFRRRIYEYGIKTGKNLFSECQAATTKVQAEIFEVNAKWIRMDSKLIGSNIAKCSRLQLIISCLQEFYLSLNKELKMRLSEEERIILEELIKRKAHQIVYPLEDKEKTEYLERYGLLLTRILDKYNDNDKSGGLDNERYSIIERVFKEHTKDENGQIALKPSNKISSDALQSAYDPDAAYKNKDGKGVKGYVMNLTETCNKEGLNLIVGVDVRKATTGDTDLFQGGVNKAEVICGAVKRVSVDGAYHSQGNQEFAKRKGIKIHLGGIPGNIGNYDFEFGEQIKVRNNITGEEMLGRLTPLGHCGIKESNGNKRYFGKKQLENYKLRKEMEKVPKEVTNVRCNVEASIFQSCFHLRKDKTRYRGKIKNEIWANCRSMWINLIRIKNHIVRLCPEGEIA